MDDQLAKAYSMAGSLEVDKRIVVHNELKAKK
jgi:hypothetical protein